MAKRMIFTLIIIAAVVSALGFIKYSQIKAAIAQGSAYKPPPEAVTTIVAVQNDWQKALNSIGTVTAAQGVVVSADLPGIVTKINFESGEKVTAGEILVNLDIKQEEAELSGAEAQKRLAHISLDRTNNLHIDKAISQADLDQAEAQAAQADAGVNQITAIIERKTIRAPFSGILGIRQINLGQYVNSGDSIVQLQSLDPVYVDFSIPQQEMAYINVGDELEVSIEDTPTPVGKGKITAINSVIDKSTRNINIRATFPNKDGRLYPGMYVQVSVFLRESSPVVAVPASSIYYTPYGDFVYVVDSIQGPTGGAYKGVKQQLVKLGDARGDLVSILDGVKPGEEVVTSGVFKLRSGTAVVVNNEIQPSNNLAPKPEDN
ncbi:MAG TPA: efflux transporter periplasmic adaptor subunit [candidate division Zixibacteria bacterium]|nr:efflux transporter periplasmic adaptor subunit [candidate division Zixibacteria bacterium]HBZ00053.1 efflux transporter periplasmic adaptor subunit [candidate division Zixibacteria bacterium]